jgi:nitrous oxidase accessory protein NosD
MHAENPGRLTAGLRRMGYCLLPVLLGAGAALALLLITGAPARPAYAGTFPACGATIQACIDAAQAGDTIFIPAGDYTESLTLNKAVSLTGQLSGTTFLHALPNTRVLTVTGAAVNSSVVISGLTFTGGNVTGSACPASCGGGVLIINQS